MQTTAKRDCNSKIFQLLRVPDYAYIIGNGSNTCQREFNIFLYN